VKHAGVVENVAVAASSAGGKKLQKKMLGDMRAAFEAGVF